MTSNGADFPASKLRPYGIEALHPDDFIVHQFDLHEAAVCRAVKKQRASLLNPPRTVEELMETFAAQSLAQTVSRLRPFAVAALNRPSR